MIFSGLLDCGPCWRDSCEKRIAPLTGELPRSFPCWCAESWWRSSMKQKAVLYTSNEITYCSLHLLDQQLSHSLLPPHRLARYFLSLAPSRGSGLFAITSRPTVHTSNNRKSVPEWGNAVVGKEMITTGKRRNWKDCYEEELINPANQFLGALL